MKKFLKKKLGNEKGMTLIELLAVIVILAIIAAIAIPAISNIIENSRQGAVKSDYQNALSAANIYFTENPTGAVTPVPATGAVVTTADLLAGGYLDDAGSLTSTAGAAGLVTITKKTGGNTISGTATASGVTYTVATLTNAQLGKIPNKSFKGGAGVTLNEAYITALATP